MQAQAAFRRPIFPTKPAPEKKSSAQVTVQTQEKKKTEYIPYEYRETELCGEKVKVKVSPASLVRDMLNHNEHNQFTEVLLVGGSGTGKTTVRQVVLHGLHEAYNYAIHFYQKDEIVGIANIIKKLPKGVDCILAFDDVSYTFRKMKPEEIAEILHKLTFVRHTVKARVILMLSIHYSFGLLKALRQAAFRIITSATDEETENYAKIFGGHNRRNIREFVKQYRAMMLYNKFTLRMGNGEPKEFRTDDPFRLALVSSLGKLHYIIYHKLNCGICNTPEEKNPGKDGRGGSEDGDGFTEAQAQYIANLYKSYPERALKMINLYTFVKTGDPVLERKDRQIWNSLSEFHEQNDIDLKKVAKILKQAKKMPLEDRDQFIKDSLTGVIQETMEKHKPQKYDRKELETKSDDPTLDVNVPDDDDDDEKKDGSAAADMLGDDDDSGDGSIDVDSLTKPDIGINELFGSRIL